MTVNRAEEPRAAQLVEAADEESGYVARGCDSTAHRLPGAAPLRARTMPGSAAVFRCGVAQLAEQGAHNATVAGANPAPATIHYTQFETRPFLPTVDLDQIPPEVTARVQRYIDERLPFAHAPAGGSTPLPGSSTEAARVGVCRCFGVCLCVGA